MSGDLEHSVEDNTPGWWPDERGQVVPFILYLMLPLAILAGVVFNTGALLDQKIESQDAADAAARAAGVWTARTLNFLSSSNIAQTKLSSAVAVIKGGWHAAMAIRWTMLAAAIVVSAANAAYIAECVGSLGTSCSHMTQNFECTADVWKGYKYWVGEQDWWNGIKNNWGSKLEQAMSLLEKAQKGYVTAAPAIIGAAVNQHYVGNLSGAGGAAAILSPLSPTSYLGFLEQRSLRYINGNSFFAVGDPSGPDREATKTWRNLVLPISIDVKNYSPSPGTLPKGVWGGFSEFESFFNNVGPFEAYRILVFPKFLRSFCMICCGKVPSLPMQMAWFWFYMEWEHKCEGERIESMKTYLLKGTPTTKPSGFKSGDDRSWDESTGQQWTKAWKTPSGDARNVVGFDFIILGARDLRDLKLFEGNSALWGQRLEEEAFSTKRFLFWPMRKMFSLSQVRVYNGTMVDMFTQDWRTTLVPVDPSALSGAAGSVLGQFSFLFNH